MSSCPLEILFFFKQKTAYERRKGDWSSDVCSSDLGGEVDEVELPPPSACGLPRLVEDLSEELEIDTRGVQCGLPDLESQSLPQGPESPEPPRSRHAHCVGLPGGVLPVHQPSQESIALGLSRNKP